MIDVVVFDDSRTVRMFVEMTLSDQGYKVQACSDLSGFQAAEQAPRLVLLDVHMDEFFGTDLIASIRQNWPGDPLIYLYSDMEEEKLRDKMMASGADGYIAKSWGFEGLIEAVRAVIGEPTEG